MIAVECFPDEVLLRAIGVPLARIVHGHGRGTPKYGDFLRALLSVDQEMQALRKWVSMK